MSNDDELEDKRRQSVHRIYGKLDQIEEKVTDTREMVIEMQAGDYGRRLDGHSKDIRDVHEAMNIYKLATNQRLDRMETRTYVLAGVISVGIGAISIFLQVLKFMLR